jgi:hypothetical protein
MGFWGFTGWTRTLLTVSMSANGEPGMRSIQRSRRPADRTFLPAQQKGKVSISCPDCQSDLTHKSELLSSYWPSHGFGRIDAKNVTIFFSAGLFNTNLRQPGRQAQLMPKTINYSHRKRRPMVATRRALIWIEGSRFQGSGCSECA